MIFLFSRVFLEEQPKSPWRLALLTNMGLAYYKAGYYSKALEAWRQASDLALPVTDPIQKPLADRAIGELAYLLARLGRMTELEKLLKSVEDRAFCGPATERIDGARGGLAYMWTRPEICFRCGPLALHALRLPSRNWPSEKDSPLEKAGFEPSVPRDTTKFSMPAHVTYAWFPARGKVGANEYRHHEDAGRLPRNRWFESYSLQRESGANLIFGDEPHR
jgi:hypothetical protein